MDCMKTGALIRQLRLEAEMTQKQLADRLGLSDKTVSKWERGLGCPDVDILTDLSRLLRVNTEDLLAGNRQKNVPETGNLKKSAVFVCPQCGNIAFCTGQGRVSCCGRTLEPLPQQSPDTAHALTVERIEDERVITASHPMEKDHFLSFALLLTPDRVQMIKQYPQWDFRLRFPAHIHGKLLWACSRHGLFSMNL